MVAESSASPSHVSTLDSGLALVNSSVQLDPAHNSAHPDCRDGRIHSRIVQAKERKFKGLTSLPEAARPGFNSASNSMLHTNSLRASTRSEQRDHGGRSDAGETKTQTNSAMDLLPRRAGEVRSSLEGSGPNKARCTGRTRALQVPRTADPLRHYTARESTGVQRPVA